MRASSEEQTGGAGLSDVTANFQRIGWGPVPNHLHDLGTDLFIQVRDARLFDRVVLVGAQVKAGPSYFSRPVSGEDETLLGWEYYESDVKHFDDWVVHQLPHLLVLHDLESRTSYWVHVTSDVVESTGKGAKVIVPVGQTVDDEHLDGLMEVATSQLHGVAFEGTAWTAAAGGVAPARRLRHALLAPRLVAPHPNSGTSREIGPEEAVALLAQGRVRDLYASVERHAAVPDLENARSHNDWRWRFVAYLDRLVSGDTNAFAAYLIEAAPNAAAATALRVVRACELFDREEYGAARAMIEEQASMDVASPVDQAWLVMQRARIRAEVGEIADARQDAAEVLRHVAVDKADVTASSLRAAASSLLFRTAAWGDQKLDDLITTNDTAVSWWRNQLISWALADAQTQRFRDWADNQSTRFATEDVVNNRLYAAQLGAHFAGDQSAWQATGSLLARNTIMASHTDENADRLASALGDLRRSGDDQTVTLAARRLWISGPLEPLIGALAGVHDRSWTHTTARANLRLWQHGGDVLPTDAAAAAVRYCFTVLSDPAWFVEHNTPSFDLSTAVLDALAGLVLAGGRIAQQEVVTYVTSLPDVTDGLTVSGLAQVLRRLHPETIPAEERVALRTVADAQSAPQLSNAILGLLLDSDAVNILLERLRNGDAEALVALGRYDRLDQKTASYVLTRDAVVLETMMSDAEHGKFSGHATDVAREVAVIGSDFPDIAPWSVLLRLLRHEQVAGAHKRGACRALAARADRLPQEVQDALKAIAPNIPDNTLPVKLWGAPLSGAGQLLAASLDALDENTLARVIVKLLSGSPTERRDAAEMIARIGRAPGLSYVPALIALLSDPNYEVRATAGGRWFTSRLRLWTTT